MDVVNPTEGFVTINGEPIPLSEWKKRFVEDASFSISEDLSIHKTFVTQIEKGDTDRTIKTIISDGKQDRDNDKINPEGWDLSDYDKNPVVLWAHDPSQPPIAKSVVKAFKSKLTSVDEFPKKGIYPLADTIYELSKGGFINAKSVGFYPTEFTFDEKSGGFDFQKQALLEHSYVPVPANPRALIVARSQGIDTQPLVMWAEYALDTWNKDNFTTSTELDPEKLFITREEMERVWADAETGHRFTFDVNSPDITWSTSSDELEKNMSDETKETSEFRFGDDAKKYLDSTREMKRLETTLREEKFSDDEIETTLGKVRELEGLTPPKKEVEKKEEEMLSVNADMLKDVVEDVIGDLKAQVTEVTGKVN